jgi:hypothetical protein
VAKAKVRVRLPTGEIVTGWAPVERYYGRTRQALIPHRRRDADGIWTLPELPPSRGRQQVARVRVRLPDGRVVVGWRAAAAALGRRSHASLSERAVLGEDGVYELDMGRWRRDVGERTLRASIADARRDPAVVAALVDAVQRRHPGVSADRIRRLVHERRGGDR